MANLRHHAGQSMVNAIALLDPAQHTLGLCYLLFVKAQSPPHDAAFLSMCESFLDNFNPAQIGELCTDKFVSVIHKYVDTLRLTGQGQRGIMRLIMVIDKFAPSPDHLTPVHADVALLCLVSRNYRAARPLLERPIFEIDPRRTGLTPRDLLLYYYYGARLWVGLQQWGRAYEFTQTVITVPASALSAIVVEAFKVYILASLITRCKMEAVPKQASPIVLRHIKKYVPEYTEFANAYTRRETEKVEELVTKYRDVFSQDHNLGMVEQAMAHYTRQAIQRLTSTYLTLSLADIATELRLPSPKHAENLLVRMIQTGELHACIDQRDGMVVFEDADPTPQLLCTVDKQLMVTQQIIERLLAMDDDVVASREYVMKQVLRDPHLRDELEQVIRSGGAKGKVRGMLETLFKG
eukprot:GGOE01014334.1.p1 GENE.GGOE01014334.1~~GGOE01014334.1.p1  ORF type:complete len:454 (+),score=87.53 GGOE01014334.1:140-1363(+)